MHDYDRVPQQSTARAAAKRRSAATSRTLPQDTVESADQTPVQSVSISAVRDEDRALDGGVGSELGDSYVDEISMRKAGKTFLPVNSERQERQEDDELRDAGVLGLLAQIYDQGRTVL
jgi:autophagy-related protein 9